MRSVVRAVCLLVLSAAATLSIAQDTAQTPQEKAWSALNNALTDKNSDQRIKATRVLGELTDDPKAADAALVALKDDNPDVRAAAAQALGEMGAKNTTPQLRAAFQDTDPKVIIAAAHSLIQLGDNSGYNVYYAVLTGQQKTGTSLTEQQKRLLKDPKKLATMGLEAGIGFVPFGGMALTGYKMLTRDDTSPVLAAAALMLAKDPDPRSGQALADASADTTKWLVRAAAFDAIAKRGDPSLLQAAEDGLNDSNEQVQSSAAGAVIRLTDIQTQRATHPHPVPQNHNAAPKKAD
jgi:HEAT repeat protein